MFARLGPKWVRVNSDWFVIKFLSLKDNTPDGFLHARERGGQARTPSLSFPLEARRTPFARQLNYTGKALAENTFALWPRRPVLVSRGGVSHGAQSRQVLGMWGERERGLILPQVHWRQSAFKVP
jgi:hypothetical protein